MNISKGGTEVLPKGPYSGEPKPELRLQRCPGDRLLLSRTDAAEPLGEPGIHIQGHRTVGEDTNRPLIKRHSMPGEGVEVARRQLNHRRPRHPMPVIPL